MSGLFTVDPAAGRSVHRNRPILILQGGRDYQVLYPAHNHLLIPGEGKCTPEEYQKVGHVDKVVIDDIVKWIEKVKK